MICVKVRPTPRPREGKVQSGMGGEKERWLLLLWDNNTGKGEGKP